MARSSISRTLSQMMDYAGDNPLKAGAYLTIVLWIIYFILKMFDVAAPRIAKQWGRKEAAIAAAGLTRPTGSLGGVTSYTQGTIEAAAGRKKKKKKTRGLQFFGLGL